MADQVHRVAEEWAAIVADWEASGLTTDAFAAIIPGLSPRTLRSQIAKTIGGVDPHRVALRLARENAKLWAEIASIDHRCTCQAASKSVLIASCRAASDSQLKQSSRSAMPLVTGPPVSGATECQAATPDLVPCADVPAAPARLPEVLEHAPEKQPKVEGGATSAVAKKQSIGDYRRTARGKFKFTDD